MGLLGSLGDAWSARKGRKAANQAKKENEADFRAAYGKSRDLFSGAYDSATREQIKEFNRANSDVYEGYGNALSDLNDGYDKSADGIGRSYDRETNALSSYLPQIRETSDTARSGIQNYLSKIINGEYSPNPAVMAAINEQATQQQEQAAAGGKFLSGGLQGELAKLRTNAILGDYNNQFTNNLNALRSFSPFANEALGLQGDISQIGIKRAQELGDIYQNQGRNTADLNINRGNALARLALTRGETMGNLALGRAGDLSNIDIGLAKEIAAGRTGYANQAIPLFNKLGSSLGKAGDSLLSAFGTGGIKMDGGAR